ncbi:Mur ligase family protein [Sedimentitalea nanhaiensis]|uniref:UDP-N-acetylmuramyl tripeptide synthase n=1 Tax=Sedimentitalea nanhaiensis TaxID=999627 RepID=A0A1I7BZU3_9RHOB|nr:Mur ligase family protein [Sedimentitalea nanhaiensis]SFT92702.1 UDP-N-acetylmuramyl tripeptide synthase [Sedimentitalea nanhaiensis]
MDRIEQLENALQITSAQTDTIRVEDVRRLTGPGLLWDYPGAVMDVFFDEIDPETVADLWHRHARRVLDALGWQGEHVIHRHFQGGSNLAISAPMDQLYSAIFAVQGAWHFCAAELLGAEPDPFETMIADIRRVMAQEANPALIRLIGAADEHGIDILCDDDEISLGHGTGSRVWSVDGLPEPDQVDWPTLHDVPVAFITGTNGKTTTTRLCTAIATAAGKVAGLTSTDMVRVGDDILDRGDYSGPGGARMLLRDRRVQIACLEVARGGILRRGLPTRRARVAVVTNVAADHLGQYGVNTVPELAQAKFAVHRTLGENGVLVLNADDAHVVAEAANVDRTICWFALSPDNPQIAGACASGRPCAYLDGTDLIFFDGKAAETITSVQQVPITLNGAAQYNVQNALAALCASKALGMEGAAIRSGLAGFQPDARDNPGRCNEFAHGGARVFVDFAHNPHSVAAVCKALSPLESGRRFILLSHAGDRSDSDIRDMTATALKFHPDVVVAAELAGYLRGRELGEVPDLIETSALNAGMTCAQVLRARSPLEGVKLILQQLQPGDLALLLVLAERDAVFQLLEGGAAQPS